MGQPYRDETTGIEEKLRQVEAELAHLDRAAARREALAGEAGELRQRLARAQSRSPLNNLRVAAPCNARWEDMVGDERVRHCYACKKDVFNISGMSRTEAHHLLESRDGNLCIRMYRRADGTVMTADCPVGERRRKVRRLVMVGAGVAAGLAGALYAWVDEPSRGGSHETGKMVATPHTVGTADPTSELGKLKAAEPPPKEDKPAPAVTK